MKIEITIDKVEYDFNKNIFTIYPRKKTYPFSKAEAVGFKVVTWDDMDNLLKS